MKNIIRVKCVESFKLYNNTGKELLADVETGEYGAYLFEETEEYFAKDSEEREFLVGELDMCGNLILQKEFDLIDDEEEMKFNQLKKQSMDLFKKHPEKINTNLLKRYLRIGLITANKLIGAIENDGVISSRDKEGSRKILI